MLGALAVDAPGPRKNVRAHGTSETQQAKPKVNRHRPSADLAINHRHRRRQRVAHPPGMDDRSVTRPYGAAALLPPKEGDKSVAPPAATDFVELLARPFRPRRPARLLSACNAPSQP